MIKNIVKTTISAILAFCCVLSFSSCGEDKIYEALEGYWDNPADDIIVSFYVQSDGAHAILISDNTLDQKIITGTYVISGSQLITTSDFSRLLGGDDSTASLAFSLSKDKLQLTLEYCGKKVTFDKFTLNLDVYPETT